MRLSRALPALVLFALSGTVIAYKVGLFELWRKPVIVTIVDAFDENADAAATAARGIKIEQAVVENCNDCKVHSVKISKSSGVADPNDLAKAIRDAVAGNSRVITVTFGMMAGTPEIEAAIVEAKAKDVVVVTAAGTGIANPFRPDELSKIFPQAYADVVVVGAASSIEDTDMLMNHGDELDVMVLGDAANAASTSIAAAMVSGAVAAKLKDLSKYNVEEVRAMLRASSKMPALSAGPGFSAVLSRVGFGVFDAAVFLDASPEPIVSRVYRDHDGGAQIELSSVVSIESLATAIECVDQTMAVKAVVRNEVLKKGRGRIVIERSGPDFSLKDCRVKISAKQSGGQERKIEVSF